MSQPSTSEAPSIAVLGAGAIGGCMAAALGDAGHRVQLCVRTPFEALQRELQGEQRRFEHPVCTDPSQVAAVDWLLLCTKAHQIAAADPWMRALVGPNTRVAVMQNGVDHADRIKAYVDAGRVVPCIIMLPASAPRAGMVEQLRPGVVQVPSTDPGRALQALFAGQQAVQFDLIEDFTSAVWAKLVLNATGGAICSLTLKPLGAMTAPAVRELVSSLISEVMAVARAEGAILPDDCVQETIRYFGGPIGEHWTSMAQDRREGRLMEWDARNAVVGRLGRRHGIATPFNDALTALLELTDDPAY